MNKKTITDLKDLKNKVVLLRVDYNVPLQDGKITDNSRIVKSLPTVKHLLKSQAKVVIFSHLGRVKSDADKAKLSLNIAAKELSKLLNKEVKFSSSTRGNELEILVKNLADGEILMVENTRYEDFRDGKQTDYESGCDQELSKYWASLGDVFVNDAFGTLHRKHASNYGIASNIKESALGFLIADELEKLNLLKTNPARPFVVILGGAKVSDKVAMINSMLSIADKVIIGPAMSYTFNLAKGNKIGASLIDKSKLDYAKELIDKHSDKLLIAYDSIAVKDINDEKEEIKYYIDIPDGYSGVDIGPGSIALIKKQLQGAKTVFWNGPVGIVEIDRFAKGSKAILDAIVDLKDATTIIGGGDSGMMAVKFKLDDKVTHISTGGGASMKFLEGQKMPALEIIEEK